MKILLSLFVISLVVLIHELGHFFVGLYLGAKPKEISIGFGKKIFQMNYKGVKLSLRWVFVGGFVNFHNYQFKAQQKSAKKAYNIHGDVIAPWKWFLISFAGPLANILYIYFAIFMLLFYSSLGAYVYKINPNQIQQIKSLTTDPIVHTEVIEYGGQDILNSYLGYEFKIKDKKLFHNKKEIINLEENPNITFSNTDISFETIIFRSIDEAITITHRIYGKIFEHISNANASELFSGAQGPSGILTESETLSNQYGILPGLILLSIVTSLSLGFINLVPLPILDGGSMLFAFIEMITNRPLPDRFIHLTTHASVILIYVYLFSILIQDLLRG